MRGLQRGHQPVGRKGSGHNAGGAEVERGLLCEAERSLVCIRSHIQVSRRNDIDGYVRWVVSEVSGYCVIERGQGVLRSANRLAAQFALVPLRC